MILMSIVCISIYVYIRLPIHTHICIYGFVKIYHRCIIHIYTHHAFIYAYTCVYMHTHMDIQTHTGTQNDESKPSIFIYIGTPISICTCKYVY